MRVLRLLVVVTVGCVVVGAPSVAAAPSPPTVVAVAVAKLPTVLQVQFVLRSFGYSVNVTGASDARTVRAVRHFQAVSGLLVDGIVGPITWDAMSTPATAVRLAPPPPPPPSGLSGLPFAPPGLDDCGQARFYRVQAGLPDVFDRLAWRESNCRNDVRTYCCYGIWQLYFTQHLADARMRPRYALCGIDSVSDYYGNDPSQKQKQACATKALYDVVGLSPWSL